jgi:ubiquinone/menaquinone biosynthesis C-methylase UbiE
MSKIKTITEENREYWSGRAGTYSEVNQRELSGISRILWKAALSENIAMHFPGRSASEISVLDVGTGPGFFAIILTELGYKVTAIDMTPEMLAEASQNAGILADKIDFREMNAESLSFDDCSFDVVVTRNLTWNLPHPAKAYTEWYRVLKDGGLLINFDANWYAYLFDEEAKQKYDEDRKNSADLGISDDNVGDNFDVMDDIASRVPLSSIARPEWDTVLLSGLDMDVEADMEIWRKVWTSEEKVNFASTPMFMVKAVKN